MQGTVKTYLPEKRYGFIKGDDGKDYFFHQNEFRNKKHVSNICEEAILSFDQKATPKGYRATNCLLLDPSEVLTYVAPEDVITSKSSDVRGWEIMERSEWIVHGASRHSPEIAKKDLIDSAEQIGANALVNMEYYKFTGSEPGTGSGTYYFTIHSFRGRAVTIAKRNSQGLYRVDDFQGVNKRAEALKAQSVKKTESSEFKKSLVWAGVMVASLVAWDEMPLLIIVFIILGIIFGHSENYDSWLENA